MFNFLDSSLPAWDLRLKVENKILHVHVQVLCTFSSFFRVMLNSDFIEKYQEVIELKDVVFEEFHKFLEVIYSPSYYLERKDVGFLFILADRFDVPIVLDKCEEYLMDNLMEIETMDSWTQTYNLLNNKSIRMESLSIPLHSDTMKRKRVAMKHRLKTGPLEWDIVVQSKRHEIFLVFCTDLSELNAQKYWEISLEVMLCIRTSEGHSCLNVVLFKDDLVGGEANNHRCGFIHNLCSVSKLRMFFDSTFSTSSLNLDIELSVVNCNAFRKAEIFDFEHPALEDVDTIIKLENQNLHVHSQILHMCLPNLAKLIRYEDDKKTIDIGSDRELNKYLPYIIHYIYCRGSLKSMFENYVVSQRVENLATNLGLNIQNYSALYTF